MFSIEALEQVWLDGEPTSDLCSHGRLRIRMGDDLITDGSEDLGISESALGLSRP